MAGRHGSSDSTSPRVPPIVLNGILLAIVAGAAWQFLHWGEGGNPRSKRDSRKPPSPEAIRKDLFRADATPLERNRAVDAWSKLGAEAVPKLLPGLEADEPAVRRYTANALAAIGRDARDAVSALRERLDDEDSDVRHAAIVALMWVDPHLEEIVPELIDFFQSEDDGLANVATEALTKTGVNCIPEVCRTLPEADRQVRRRCVVVLRQVGDTDPQAISALHSLLSDPDPEIGREAFQTLADWDVLTLREVLDGLQYDHKDVTSTVMRKLAGFESELESVVPELMEIARDPELGLKSRWAGHLLGLFGQIGRAASEAVPDVRALVEAKDSHVGEADLFCLARIATQDRDVVPYLRERIFGEQPWTAHRAASALRLYNPEIARAMVPELIAELREGSESAAASLGGIGPEAEAAVPALMEALADPGSLVAEYAAGALGNIGPAARPAVPRLAELLDHAVGERPSRTRILNTFAQIGPDAEAAVPKLTAFIDEARAAEFRNPPEQRYGFDSGLFEARDAIRTLGHIGAGAGTAVPLLLELASHPRVNDVVLGALERIAAADARHRAAALDAARTVLQKAPAVADQMDLGRNGYARIVAVRVLARFEEPSAETISELSAVLEDASPHVRAMAALGLGHMGAAARSAVPALRSALNDPANALSHRGMPTGLSVLTQSMSYYTYFYGDLYHDASAYPMARRSVRFAVLEALKNITPHDLMNFDKKDRSSAVSRLFFHAGPALTGAISFQPSAVSRW